MADCLANMVLDRENFSTAGPLHGGVLFGARGDVALATDAGLGPVRDTPGYYGVGLGIVVIARASQEPLLMQ